MISQLKRLWQMRPYLTSAFLLACAVTLFFAGRFVFQVVYWANHQDVTIQPWMTVGYIARSYDLDPRELDRMAGLPLPVVKGRPQPLQEIAKDRGVPVEDIIADVERAMKVMRAVDPAP
jgi:hypothetical protein